MLNNHHFRLSRLTFRSVNIANANVFGLSKELGIASGTKYNTALVIFFVPYILFEIPSNIILKKLKPRVWLSICMFGFGLVTVRFPTSHISDERDILTLL